MRSGRRLAFDHGAARIGVSSSTFDGIFASPLRVIPVNGSEIDECLNIIAEIEPIEIYIGLPLNLQGDFTLSTESALLFARKLAAIVDVPIRMIDERLSTRAAQSQLQASGKNTKESKTVIDAAAATLILEGALAKEKLSGQLPGKALLEFDE